MPTHSTTPTPSHASFPRVRHVFEADGPRLYCAADYPAEPVKWLWPGRIPLGSITLLAGNPGTGKSLFALDLAARVSTASPWPDDPTNFASSATTNPQNPRDPNAGDSVSPCLPFSLSRNSTPNPEPRTLYPPATPGSVLILSASDPLADTIRPRLDAAGADPERIHLVGNITNLRAEMNRLRQAVDAIPDLRLLIIDPINFYVGPGDAHFQTVVRTVLAPLAELARKRGFAILAVTHFRKNDGAAIHRAAGSMGFVATARAIWTITEDHDDPSRRYLVPLKQNLTTPASTLSFRITSQSPSPPTPTSNACVFATNTNSPNPEPRTLNPLAAPHLRWNPAPVDAASIPADSPKHSPKKPTLRDEAQAFLREALAAGPRPASELIDAADARGLNRRTVQRAFHDLAGHAAKRGFRAGWWWSLGDYPIAPIPTMPLEHCVDPSVAPTYAADVADQLCADRILAENEQALVREFIRPRKNVSPSPRVSPSQESRENNHPAPNDAVSPSANRSPSTPLSPSPPDPKAAHLPRQAIPVLQFAFCILQLFLTFPLPPSPFHPPSPY